MKQILILLCGIVLLTPLYAQTIHEERSVYRDITVTERFGRRCLLFNVHRGDRNQTCIFTDGSSRLVFDYTKMSFAGLLLKPDPKRVLIAGLGGGTIPLVLSELFPSASIDVIEIDESVARVANEFFFFEETDLMRVHINDARVFIKRAALKEEKYDYIVLDAFSGDYIPEHMLTQEFLEEVKQVLTPDGVVVANTFSTSRFYDHESVTYQRVFGELYNFKLPTSGNRIILTQLEPLPDIGLLTERAVQLAPQLGKYGIPFLSYPEKLSSQVDWDMSRRVLTDQYSPSNLLRDN